MRTNRCSKMLLALILLFTAALPAYTQQKLTLDQAIDIALEKSAETQIARMEITKADAAVREAYGYAMPTVDFSTNFSHLFEKPMMPFPDFEVLIGDASLGVLLDQQLITKEQFDDSFVGEYPNVLQSFAMANSYEAKIEVQQILFNSAVFRGIGAAQVYKDMSNEQLKSTISSTVLNTKKAFYGVLLTKDLLRIANESLKNGQDNLQNVKALHNQGMVSDYELMQVEVQIENIKPMITQLETALKSAKEGLKVTIGMDMNKDIDVEGQLEYSNTSGLEVNAITKEALRSNLNLKTLKKKLEMDGVIVDVEKSDWWPTVAAFGSYAKNGMSDDFSFMNYNTGVVGIAFSMNLFRGMQTTNKVQQQQIVYNQTRLQIAQLQDAIKMQVKTKIAELESISSTIEAQEKNIILAQKTYEMANVRYKEGTGNQLEIQNADMQLKQAKTNRLQSVHNYIIARSELDQLIGKLDPKYYDSK